MNPSSPGWINKFGSLLKTKEVPFLTYEELYLELLNHGFIYGIHLDIPSFITTEHRLSEDEIAKINLLAGLYFSYRFEVDNSNFEEFVETVFTFYQEMEVGRISFLNKILSGNKTMTQLEKLLDSRIYLNGNVFNKAFGNSLTNSLLYIDVLIFKAYLSNTPSLTMHAQLLEYVTINIAYQALNSKEANESDAKLMQLLASSLTYVDLKNANFEGTYADLLQQNFSDSEKDYLLDIACLTVWEDSNLDHSESEFIFAISDALNKTKNKAKNALENVKKFFEKNHQKIPYLQDTNLASKFYDGMTKNVSKLILRNSKRLKKELSESRELVQLLAKSASKDLNEGERKKVQGQLLDIFKSIPSLAIFMLPGGAVLLPIFIKLIPKLLPSAFDDNRVEENQ
ncbi:LETM1-related biofilm-associated protein [Croceitalea rosinachiae]|uniref:LETM1-related biofilm-associated protein n=1 Tax=Croceitalea rosinachiae TaxID=3075596 RepID=A0ABU3AAV7_9FLAO|nr:LETM1-related biofilm-associated protein [Croceitalea sp. F388]MDT0607109.1 LETM1-related biofilm-associated protein [Croceitalea sp. F388]